MNPTTSSYVNKSSSLHSADIQKTPKSIGSSKDLKIGAIAVAIKEPFQSQKSNLTNHTTKDLENPSSHFHDNGLEDTPLQVDDLAHLFFSAESLFEEKNTEVGAEEKGLKIEEHSAKNEVSQKEALVQVNAILSNKEQTISHSRVLNFKDGKLTFSSLKNQSEDHLAEAMSDHRLAIPINRRLFVDPRLGLPQGSRVEIEDENGERSFYTIEHFSAEQISTLTLTFASYVPILVPNHLGSQGDDNEETAKSILDNHLYAHLNPPNPREFVMQEKPARKTPDELAKAAIVKANQLKHSQVSESKKKREKEEELKNVELQRDVQKQAIKDNREKQETYTFERLKKNFKI